MIKKLIKKIRQWKWRRKDPRINTLTPEALRELADALEAHERAEAGDGEAVFLSEMTDEEYADYKYRHLQGWQSVLGKVENLPRNGEGGNA